ncbi:MAG: ABC transporter ATP-binding protein [Pseudomonadota bacterium]
MASVRADGIAKTFGAVRAVDGVSFDVGSGAFLTLLGPSGCGKTTTMRIIAGLEAADEGEIFIDDAPLSSVPVWKRDLGVVFQNYALFPLMTVGDNVAFGLRRRGLQKADVTRRVGDVLSLVGLEGMGARYPRQLSGGQQQRVALARALVIEPKVLLLDEPLSNLDARLRADMRVELRAIQRRTGVTTLFVTHDQEEALTMSDRIILMRDGQIVRAGTPQEVWEAPASAFAADFLGVENLFTAEIAGEEASVGGTTLRLPGSCDGPAILGIRAEHVVMTGEGAPNTVAGTIVEAQYRGSVTDLRVKTALKQTPIVVASATPRSIGEEVTLTLPPERLMRLDPDLKGAG